MRKRYAVLGLGRFGSSVAKVLMELGQYVLAVDSDEGRVDAMASVLSRAVKADVTDPAVLRVLRIAEFDAVIVAIGANVEASVITVINCKDLGVKKLIAKAQDEPHGRVLERLAVDRVVYPQRDMGARVASNISAGGVIDFVRLSEQYGMAELEPPESLIGKSLQELDMPSQYGLNVMAIKRGKRVIVSPRADERVTGEDLLVVIGDANGISRLQGS